MVVGKLLLRSKDLLPISIDNLVLAYCLLRNLDFQERMLVLHLLLAYGAKVITLAKDALVSDADYAILIIALSTNHVMVD